MTSATLAGTTPTRRPTLAFNTSRTDFAATSTPYTRHSVDYDRQDILDHNPIPGSMPRTEAPTTSALPPYVSDRKGKECRRSQQDDSDTDDGILRIPQSAAAQMLTSGGRFCSSGSTWYRTEPRSDGNPPPSYGDRDLHHGPAGDRCLQLEIAVSSRGWLESSSAFPSSVHTKPCRGVYMYIRQLEVVVNGPTILVWRTSAMGATRSRPILASC